MGRTEVIGEVNGDTKLYDTWQKKRSIKVFRTSSMVHTWATCGPHVSRGLEHSFKSPTLNEVLNGELVKS